MAESDIFSQLAPLLRQLRRGRLPRWLRMKMLSFGDDVPVDTQPRPGRVTELCDRLHLRRRALLHFYT